MTTSAPQQCRADAEYQHDGAERNQHHAGIPNNDQSAVIVQGGIHLGRCICCFSGRWPIGNIFSRRLVFVG